MAKSACIKEIVNGNCDATMALKRLKVLLACFDKPELSEWVDNELKGYAKDVPPYRIFHGTVKGTFLVGNCKFNTLIPIHGLDNKKREYFERQKIRSSIGSLEDMIITHDGNAAIEISPLFYDDLMKSSNIDSIVYAYVQLSRSEYIDLKTVVITKVLDILLLLEKEFGPLDDMDIDISAKESEEVEKIIQQIYQIIYQDNSITIGDHNKISHSTIETIAE